jgi:hypothetical protein
LFLIFLLSLSLMMKDDDDDDGWVEFGFGPAAYHHHRL